MPVAIIDVGSNTARLLVVERTGSGLEAICEERAYLALGSLIARARARARRQVNPSRV